MFRHWILKSTKNSRLVIEVVLKLIFILTADFVTVNVNFSVILLELIFLNKDAVLCFKSKRVRKRNWVSHLEKFLFYWWLILKFLNFLLYWWLLLTLITCNFCIYKNNLIVKFVLKKFMSLTLITFRFELNIFLVVSTILFLFTRQETVLFLTGLYDSHQ